MYERIHISIYIVRELSLNIKFVTNLPWRETAGRPHGSAGFLRASGALDACPTQATTLAEA